MMGFCLHTVLVFFFALIYLSILLRLFYFIFYFYYDNKTNLGYYHKDMTWAYL